MGNYKFFSLSWGLIILAALFDSYAAFIVKTKFNELGAINFSSLQGVVSYIAKFLKSPLMLTAVIAFVLAPGLWFLALNRIDLSVGYPALVGFHLIFVLVFGIFCLGEVMTVNKSIAVVLIFISLYFLYR